MEILGSWTFPSIKSLSLAGFGVSLGVISFLITHGHQFQYFNLQFSTDLVQETIRQMPDLEDFTYNICQNLNIMLSHSNVQTVVLNGFENVQDFTKVMQQHLTFVFCNLLSEIYFPCVVSIRIIDCCILSQKNTNGGCPLWLKGAWILLIEGTERRKIMLYDQNGFYHD